MESKLTISFDGIKYWYLNGGYHREDGPAIEYPNGSKSWFLNGKYHREDGPAIECSNGYIAWYVNGKCHREDGPAIEYPNGTKEWWLNGTELTKQQLLSKKMKINYPDLCNSYVVRQIMES